MINDTERLDRDRWSVQGSPVNETTGKHLQSSKEGTG